MRWKAAALAAAGMMGVAGAANAQAVTFSGHTFGCFYTGSVIPMCTSTTSTVGSLTYFSSVFTVTSNAADGLLTIGEAPTPPANVNNLGSLTLVGGSFNYTNQKLALVIDFTAPPGSTASTYSAVLTGNLSMSATGNVDIDFNNTPHEFRFDDGTVLQFSVNDQSVNDNAGGTATVPLTGRGVVITPEPASMTLLATGLMGIFGAARRRRKNIAA